jgi:predicted dinucleotide-utilizing enzyme
MTQNNKQTIQQKREELKALSTPFKMLIKEGAIGSINEGLANYYSSLGHSTIKSYKQWKQEGFQVKRGSKALLFWGEPKKIEQNPETAPKEGQKESFFPLAYLFSNLQVEAIETSQMRR